MNKYITSNYIISMTKTTKQIKRHKTKNKTRKYYGGGTVSDAKKAYAMYNDMKKANDMYAKGKGIFNDVSDKALNMLKESTDYLKLKGLRILGLKPINEEGVEPTTKSSENMSGLAQGLASNAQNIGSNMINGFNKNLASPQVTNTIMGAAEKTAELSGKLLDNFNRNFSNPELKAKAVKALDNAAEYSTIFVKAMDEPLNAGIDEIRDAVVKASSGLTSGAIKLGTDAMAAVPGVGAIVELGKMANDASAALGDVVEAGSQASSTISKIVKDTSQNMEKGVKELEEKKMEAAQIQKRTDSSINEFENSSKSGQGVVTQNLKGGNNKTRRKIKNKK